MALFPTVINQRRGKKPIRKAIKYKSDSFSKKQLAFFIVKTFKLFFMGRGGHVLCDITTQCERKSISDSPLAKNHVTCKTSIKILVYGLKWRHLFYRNGISLVSPLYLVVTSRHFLVTYSSLTLSCNFSKSDIKGAFENIYCWL